MDISETILANSSQINAEDLIGGSVTVTITSVEKGTAEQPVFIHLAEFSGRTFRPAKTVRRILVAAWGKSSEAYIGRRLTLFNDPTVKWGGQEVGGVRVSHMSDIGDKPLTFLLTTSRGKRAPFTVQPLPTGDDANVTKALDAINKADTIDRLDAITAHADRIGIGASVADAIDKRRAELGGAS